MTDNLEVAPAAATVAGVWEWLAERGYTVAPVERENPPYPFVERETLADVAVDKRDHSVYKHAEGIEFSHLLSLALDFAGIVEKLEAEPI